MVLGKCRVDDGCKTGLDLGKQWDVVARVGLLICLCERGEQYYIKEKS